MDAHKHTHTHIFSQMEGDGKNKENKVNKEKSMPHGTKRNEKK